MAIARDVKAELIQAETLIRELDGQSDRGAAIVGVALVEDTLTSALHSFLDSHPKAWQRLFHGSAPLANFSAKIDLCRLIGLITDTIYSDLHILRDVRNQFAHQVMHKADNSQLTFTTPHIQDKCMSLKCVAHEELQGPRHAFVRACLTLYADFELIPHLHQKVSKGGYVFAKFEKECLF